MQNKTIHKIFSVIALAALFVGNFGVVASAFAVVEPAPVTVTIVKYIGSQKATAQTASSTDFQMSATWNAQNIGAGTGQYALSANGFGGDPTPYQAVTAEMTSGASYTTNEIMNSVVGATCDTDAPFALVGYSQGDTLQQAEMASQTLTPPNFVNLTSNKFVIVWNRDCSLPATVKVHINKYIDGAQATALTASSSDFQMNASWNAANIGAGSGQYTLSASGYNADPTPYQAVTVDMTSGANYATSEIIGGTTVVGETCESGKPFTLTGYSVGNSLLDAQQASVSTTSPNFTNLTNDKYVIVRNMTCPVPSSLIKVHILKYVDAVKATASSTSSFLFPMSATWKTANLNGGATTTGSYVLGNNQGGAIDQYGADTAAMQTPANYSTYEVTDPNSLVLPIGAQCVTGKYRVDGYKTSFLSFADAFQAPLVTVAPNFYSLQSDAYVIVFNTKCGNPSGTLDGDVTGGVSDDAALAVTSIDRIQTTATADDTYGHGWKYVFHITAPNSEPKLAMKFADWMNTTSSSTLAVANNMRISSAQADNGGATITLTAANTYSAPDLNMVTDLDPVMPGRQVQVTVEVKIPTTTVNGSYTTTYGVRTVN